ncbi:hypothetical protein ACQKPX_24655, partial [Photobacterium sp. DNB23_23_1]
APWNKEAISIPSIEGYLNVGRNTRLRLNDALLKPLYKSLYLSLLLIINGLSRALHWRHTETVR